MVKAQNLHLGVDEGYMPPSTAHYNSIADHVIVENNLSYIMEKPSHVASSGRASCLLEIAAE